MQRKTKGYFQNSSDHSKVPACQPLASVHLALYVNEWLSVNTESVKLDQEKGRHIPCYVFASYWLCGFASKLALETWC